MKEQSAAAEHKPTESIAAPAAVLQKDSSVGGNDVVHLEAIKKLAELRDLGILTEDEFCEKKASIMARI